MSSPLFRAESGTTGRAGTDYPKVYNGESIVPLQDNWKVLRLPAPYGVVQPNVATAYAKPATGRKY